MGIFFSTLYIFHSLSSCLHGFSEVVDNSYLCSSLCKVFVPLASFKILFFIFDLLPFESEILGGSFSSTYPAWCYLSSLALWFGV